MLFILSWLFLTQAANAPAPNVGKEVGIIWADLGGIFASVCTPFICGKADLVFFPVESHTGFPQHYHEVKLDSNIQEDSMPILAFFAR